jgi:hypothetical protein
VQTVETLHVLFGLRKAFNSLFGMGRWNLEGNQNFGGVVGVKAVVVLTEIISCVCSTADTLSLMEHTDG